MSGEFVHFVEPQSVILDPGREIHVSLGSVGGMTLAYLGVNNQDILLTLPELRRLIESLGHCDPELAERRDGYYLYRVVITSHPDGSWFSDEVGGVEQSWPNVDWAPEGWDPDEEYVSRFGTRKFFWPSTKFKYRSLSSARSRAKLIENYGATVTVERSSLITWPAVDVVVPWWSR